MRDRTAIASAAIGMILIALNHSAFADQVIATGRGVGVLSCAEFAKSYARNPKQAEALAFSWAQGFMSAANLSFKARGQKKFRDQGGDIQYQEQIVRTYCDEHPLKLYMDAVLYLYSTLPWEDEPLN